MHTLDALKKAGIKDKIKKILAGSLAYLKNALKIEHELHIDFIDIFGEREVGKYYCAKCGMFFEFGIKRDTVTCPLMSQKCMFDPQHIDKVTYSPDKFVKQFEITPDIYKRFAHSVDTKNISPDVLSAIAKEWKITDRQVFSLSYLFPRSSRHPSERMLWISHLFFARSRSRLKG